MKIFSKVLIILILIGAVLTGVFFFLRDKYYKSLEEPNSDVPYSVEVEILPGEDIKTIAKKLKDKGVIKNADIFYWYVKFEGIGSKVQAGKFNIPQNLNIKEVAAVIQTAAGDDVWVRFQEGLRADEIAELLELQFIKTEGSSFNKAEFMNIINFPDDKNLNADILKYKPEGNSLEGFIYPDTYSVSKSISTKELVELFLNNFEEKIGQETINKFENSPEGFYGSLTMASIVEREGRSGDERPMIANVLLKRIRTGLEDGTKLLQADATLLYLQKDWETPVTSDLKAQDDPYNTYINPGLPPTPISNPGLESINGVANPRENDYLYYLHGNDGEIRYAKTFEEHENNQRCYINDNKSYCP